MEILESLISLIERDPSSGILLLSCIVAVWFFRNQSNAIALAASIVATFHPIETAINKLVENITTLNTNTLQSHTLIISLGERLTAHQEKQNTNHAAILQRFDSCSTKLHDILNHAEKTTDLMTLSQQIQTDLSTLKELYTDGNNAISSSIRRTVGGGAVNRANVGNSPLGSSRPTKGDGS